MESESEMIDNQAASAKYWVYACRGAVCQQLVNIYESTIMILPSSVGCQRDLGPFQHVDQAAEILVEIELDCLDGVVPMVEDRQWKARQASLSKPVDISTAAYFIRHAMLMDGRGGMKPQYERLHVRFIGDTIGAITALYPRQTPGLLRNNGLYTELVPSTRNTVRRFHPLEWSAALGWTSRQV